LAEREMVRDAVALARLYQRACLPVENLDHQTFGMAPDIGSEPEYHWKADAKGYAGHGWSRIGVLGPFKFTKRWIRDFRTRASFAFLDDALRAPDPEPGSWAQRAITAVRLLNVASPMRPQPLRIVLQAAALEALLGDDPLPDPWKARSQAHPVAQRAAFVTCDRPDGARLREGDSACYSLVADSASKAELDPHHGRRPRDCWDWPCTYYWHIRQVFDARNRALHDAQDQFPKSTAVRYEGRVDEVVLAAVDWVATNNATGIHDLDGAIGALPHDPATSRDV
jgi:hypothetical protein